MVLLNSMTFQEEWSPWFKTYVVMKFVDDDDDDDYCQFSVLHVYIYVHITYIQYVRDTGCPQFSFTGPGGETVTRS